MKKVFAIVLAAMLVMSLFAGCGQAGTAGNVDLGGNKGGNETATTIKVGTSGPLTGDYAVYGVAVANGLELAFEEINAMQSELKFETKAGDDEADSEKAVSAYNNLMDWGMVIMAGPTTSGSAAATAAECATDKVFMITPSASDAAVIEAGDNVFQICFTDPNQGKASAQYIKNNNLATKVGIIYDSSSPYSAGIKATFVEEAKALSLETVEFAFTEDTKGDLTTQVTKCQQEGCDLVFLPIYTAEATKVLSLASTMSYDAKFFGCDGLDGILTVEGFDPALAEGVMLLTPFDATSEDAKTQAFVKAYTEKFGITPNQFAADAYDVGYAIYEACKAAGVTADMDAAAICQKMVEQFTTMSFDGVTGIGMTWDASGAVSKAPMAVVIEKNEAGEYVYASME